MMRGKAGVTLGRRRRAISTSWSWDRQRGREPSDGRGNANSAGFRGFPLNVPTAFTHALVGSSLASFSPPAVGRGRLAIALVAVSVLPDFDVVAFRFGIPYEHPFGHRGFSHSLLFAALVAPLGAAIFHRSVTFASRQWLVLWGLFFSACALHGVLDAFTDAGLGIGFFVPFSEARYFAPWRPIITSPLGVRAFFYGRGAEILANEFFWIWLPTVALVVGARFASSARRRIRAPRNPDSP
jgi:inner membrane protein